MTRTHLAVAAVTIAGGTPPCRKRPTPWPLRVAAVLAPLVAALAFATPASTPMAQAASRSRSSPHCTSLDYGFSDSFETHYHAPGGLNPHACGPVYGTRPGDRIKNNGTWIDNVSSVSGERTNCIEQGKPPAPGKGTHAVRIHANRGNGSHGLAQDCTWMNTWRYIKYPATTYYGLMWYFPKRGYTDPSPGNHDATMELNFHPFIYAAPVGLSLHGDTLQVYVNSGAWCHGCRAKFRNGGEYEHPSSSQNNLGPIKNWRVVPKGHLKRNKWIETIVGVHWSSRMTGSIHAWWRVKGQSRWNETVKRTGFPTIAWGPDSSQNFKWTPHNENGVTTLDHIGIYRTGVNPAPATTFWIDNYQRQPTFAAVAKTMP